MEFKVGVFLLCTLISFVGAIMMFLMYLAMIGASKLKYSHQHVHYVYGKVPKTGWYYVGYSLQTEVSEGEEDFSYKMRDEEVVYEYIYCSILNPSFWKLISAGFVRFLYRELMIITAFISLIYFLGKVGIKYGIN
ncbi:MAG: hypothetical protein ACRCX8_20470 [Sarcina sp.]